jgi:hypothetical protein
MYQSELEILAVRALPTLIGAVEWRPTVPKADAVQTNGFNSPQMVGINSATVG